MSSLLSWIPGTYTRTFTHSDKPLVLPTSDGPQRSFPSIVEECVPPCRLNPFLFNGHLQTAMTAYLHDGPQIHYRRRVFTAEDPAFHGTFAVDFAVAPPTSTPRPGETGNNKGINAEGLLEDPSGVGHNYLPPRTTYFSDDEFERLPSSDTKPLLITLHGLSGGSHEIYVLQCLGPLLAATAQGAEAGLSGGDWEALVVNARGCAGTKLTTSMLYNARSTWDARQVIRWARKTWPNRPLYGLGFSLGANKLVHYLAEEGSSCLLTAACVISCPFNLEIANVKLNHTFMGRIYSRAMGSNMKKIFEMHKDMILQNKAIVPERVEKIQTLYEFDREIQCAGWGYPTVDAYYRDAASSDAVLDIRVPTFVLHAQDDPIAWDLAVPYHEIERTPWVVVCTTSGGGHLSWFEIDLNQWHAKPVVNFFNAMRAVESGNIGVPKVEVIGPVGGHKAPFEFSPSRRKMHNADAAFPYQ